MKVQIKKEIIEKQFVKLSLVLHNEDDDTCLEEDELDNIEIYENELEIVSQETVEKRDLTEAEKEVYEEEIKVLINLNKQ